MFAEIPLSGPKAPFFFFLCPTPSPYWEGQLEVSPIAPALVAGLYRGVSWMLLGTQDHTASSGARGQILCL